MNTCLVVVQFQLGYEGVGVSFEAGRMLKALLVILTAIATASVWVHAQLLVPFLVLLSFFCSSVLEPDLYLHQKTHESIEIQIVLSLLYDDYVMS